MVLEKMHYLLLKSRKFIDQSFFFCLFIQSGSAQDLILKCFLNPDPIRIRGVQETKYRSGICCQFFSAKQK